VYIQHFQHPSRTSVSNKTKNKVWRFTKLISLPRRQYRNLPPKSRESMATPPY
jgi:hypothetical protein